MDTVYLVSAIVGAALLIGQLVLGALGLGHDADHDAGGGEVHAEGDHGHSWFVGMLSLRAVTSGIMLFGLCGLAADSAGSETVHGLAVAAAGGIGGLMLVGQSMKWMNKLAHDGTVRIERSVGKAATVYLTVPPSLTNAGKVHLRLQNRTVEYQAVTTHPDPIPTGSQVTVVSVVNSDTVEVSPDPKREVRHHE